MIPPVLARRMWHHLEPVHALVYFTPHIRRECEAAGMKGFWMAYFASRAAAMGPVPAAVVEATFFNFAPSRVRRAIPDAWSLGTPEAVLAARYRAAAAALADIAGDVDLTEVAELARRATTGCTPEGRPLYAAHAALPWPDDPPLVLWHAATLLREHRGDGHVAALVAAGLDGCEALVSAAEAGLCTKELFLVARGWTEEEWEAAAGRLRARGWSAEQRAAVEARTDELDARPWATLGEDGCARLLAALAPLLDRLNRAGLLPYPNPIGLPPPASS